MIRYVVISHRQELIHPDCPGPSAVWYDSDQYFAARAFASTVAFKELRRVHVQKIDMGVCGCGPASVTDGTVTIFAEAWGDCMGAGGPDCGCDCHELESMFEQYSSEQ